MILRAAALLIALAPCAAPPAAAQTAAQAAGQSAAAQATKAAADLQDAIAALDAAQGARDRVSALTRTIRAYETGLAALREALRQAQLREAALILQLNAKRDRVAQLVGVLGQMERDPGPLMLLHPDGPLGTVRSGMMLAEVTPALQAEAETLNRELGELRDLRALQASAGDTLLNGLRMAQTARTTLSKAISERTDLPRRFTEDPAALKSLLDSTETLDAFAAGLTSAPPDTAGDFAGLKGRLPLPVLGTLLRRPGEADAAGQRRPGMVLATRAAAVVTAPAAATIRYRGPLLDYGNVMILEPGGGYLLILAGLGTVYGEVGEVVAAGAPLGLMPGGADAVELLAGDQEGGGALAAETLYMELRSGTDPVDPTEWFAATTG